MGCCPKPAFPCLILLLLLAPPVLGEEVQYEWKVIILGAKTFLKSSNNADILKNGTILLRLGGSLSYEMELPFEPSNGSYVMIMANVSSDSSELSIARVKVSVCGREMQYEQIGNITPLQGWLMPGNLFLIHGVFYNQFIYFGETCGKKLPMQISYCEAIAGNASILLSSLRIELFIPKVMKGGAGPLPIRIPPLPPRNLSATFTGSSIVLNWTEPLHMPVAGYAIYRGISPKGESSRPIAIVPAGITSYVDTNITPGTTYYYYVRAFDDRIPPSYSEPSNEVRVKVPIYVITASAGPGGEISPSGNITVKYKTNKTFTITPSAGYRIKDVLVDSRSLGPVPSYTFVNITTNHTIEAIFEKEITPYNYITYIGAFIAGILILGLVLWRKRK
ncbi:MAG: fibronectin type III domain-containing protein [Candidatus Methanodesulfokora sp.]